VVLVALATSFAISTATFNTTYQAQAEVDARLTNGADISLTQPGNDNALSDAAARIGAIPGVRTVEPMQHRYAYVGTDLQDLYGVRPGTIGAATSLQDAYFSGGTAAELMQRLATQADGILVSQETVTDFQLVPGDQLKLRLQDGRTRQYVEVPFTYVGIAKEFPTAPSDSFLVATAGYVGSQTHNDAPGTLLIDAGGQHTAAIADQVQRQVGPGGHVTDISTVRGTIGSSLTSVSLQGLTAVELTAAIVLAVAASGLVLGLGYNERRRSYAIAAILGARRRELSGFITLEAAVVVLLGLAGGAVLGAMLAQTLTTVLGGVFDPPPASLAVPWPYLALLGLSVAAATIIAIAVFTRRAGDAPIEALRDA
jgi:putative ABC transport system permease protein